MTTTLALLDGTGVMLCGHGSRNQLAVGEFASLAARLRERLPGVLVEYGYLEFANPVLHAGLDKLRAQGLTRIYRRPRHVVRRRPRQERHPLGAQHLRRACIRGTEDHLWARTRRRPQDAACRRRPHRRGHRRGAGPSGAT